MKRKFKLLGLGLGLKHIFCCRKDKYYFAKRDSDSNIIKMFELFLSTSYLSCLVDGIFNR